LPTWGLPSDVCKDSGQQKAVPEAPGPLFKTWKWPMPTVGLTS
jgi:hypothetical protein